MAQSGGERLLGAEAISALGIVAIAQIRRNGTLAGSLNYGQFAGVATFYAILALAAMFGPKAASASASLGGLVLLSIGLTNGKTVIEGISGLARPNKGNITFVNMEQQQTVTTQPATLGQTPGFQTAPLGPTRAA